MNAALSDTTMNAAAAMGDAYAKINLTLDVQGRRDDGFHEIRSLVIGVGLRDRVCCRLSRTSELTLRCSDSRIPEDQNLVGRAALMLAERLGRAPSCEIQLDKLIPLGAGMGGGSSDAATTLRVLNELWSGGLGEEELASIGAELGSDVPLFFHLPGARMTGRGDRVEPISLRWRGWVLLVFVAEIVSTPRVYGLWRREDAADMPRKMDEAIVAAETADQLSALLSNHLEPAVFRVSPRVAQTFEALHCRGLGPMRVAGAGSTLYRLFDEPEAARRAAAGIEDLGLGVTTRIVEAPAGPGPIVTEEC